MKYPDDVDARLGARFEQEHRQVPGDVFVDTTMKIVRAKRRRRVTLDVGWRAAALAAAMWASPWLIEGVTRLNAAVEFSLSWAKGQPVMWALGVLAILVAMARRLRSR